MIWIFPRGWKVASSETANERTRRQTQGQSTRLAGTLDDGKCRFKKQQPAVIGQCARLNFRTKSLVQTELWDGVLYQTLLVLSLVLTTKCYPPARRNKAASRDGPSLPLSSSTLTTLHLLHFTTLALDREIRSLLFTSGTRSLSVLVVLL
ncbi:hypothetical protein TMatcc_005449 [Talaromyces marneffei ATCC 18224]